MSMRDGRDWAPESCTLPTAQRPLRMAEFDELFATVRTSTRREPTQLQLVVPSAAELTARELADHESQCCSFFTFQFERAGAEVLMRIGVPPEQTEVLDAIEARLHGRA
jgi:hypothetical protein